MTSSSQEVRRNWLWVILQGFQQLFSCVGATVLAPILMGIPPHMALFTSGLGTIPYVLYTRLPIFLGSSFAYIAAISMVMQEEGRAAVAGGIIAAGIVSIAVSFVVRRQGISWIGKIIPTEVNANVLIAIGMVLTQVAWGNTSSNWGFGIFTILMILLFALAFPRRHAITGLPIFLAIVVCYVVGVLTGQVDFSPVANASFFTLPDFVMPVFSLYAVMTIVWPTIATIAEDYADVQALGVIFEEDLDNKVADSLLFDGVADILSFTGNPSTPYNESLGATQLAKNQRPEAGREMFIPVVIVAALLAISAGFLGWVTPLVSSIPIPIVGGAFWVIVGIISLLGIRLFAERNVDFLNPQSYLITATMTFIWMTGAAGGQFQLFGKDMGAIAACALVGIVMNQLRKVHRLSLLVAILSVAWLALGGWQARFWLYLLVALLTPFAYHLILRMKLDFSNRWVQIPGAVIFTLIVGLLLQIQM